jgi:hypothetical protein
VLTTLTINGSATTPRRSGAAAVHRPDQRYAVDLAVAQRWTRPTAQSRSSSASRDRLARCCKQPRHLPCSSAASPTTGCYATSTTSLHVIDFDTVRPSRRPRVGSRPGCTRWANLTTYAHCIRPTAQDDLHPGAPVDRCPPHRLRSGPRATVRALHLAARLFRGAGARGTMGPAKANGSLADVKAAAARQAADQP